MKFGTFKILFALLFVSLFFSQAESQAPKDDYTLKYGNKYSFTGCKNGTVYSKKQISDEIINKFFQYNLMNVKIFGKNGTNMEEIKEYSIDTSNITWTLYNKPSKQIELISNGLKLELGAYSGTLLTKIQNKGVEIDKQKYNFTDIEYHYTFNYKSFLPYPYRLYGYTYFFSLVDNGIDNITADVKQNKFIFKENSFTLTTRKNAFEFIHSLTCLYTDYGKKIRLNNILYDKNIDLLFQSNYNSSFFSFINSASLYPDSLASL